MSSLKRPALAPTERQRSEFDIDSYELHEHSDLIGRLSRLSDRGIALIVKRAAEGAGLDPSTYSGHSLRAGFATTAAANGAPERAIANQTGHKSLEVLRRYVRHGQLFTDNAATQLGL